MQENLKRCLSLFGYGKKQDTENDIVEKEDKPIISKKRMCLLSFVMDKNKLDSTKFVSIDKGTNHLDFL